MRNSGFILLLLLAGFLFSCSNNDINTHQTPDQEPSVNIQAYAPLSLPNPTQIKKIEAGNCTLVDHSISPPDTFYANICSGVGTNQTEGVLMLEQISSLDTLNLDLDNYGSYSCDEIKMIEVSQNKVCISTMTELKKRCIDLNTCSGFYFYVKGDNTVKLFVPNERGCGVTSN